jgi:SNF2 family DNA or RNA helicase
MEERVVELQRQKLELAAGLLSNSKKAAGGGLNIKEMRQLFMI